MEPEADALTGKLGQLGDRLTGRVRLTAVPILVNHVLVPALGPLLKAHPDLDVELVPEARDLNLTRREADLALRLARPRDGGQEVLTRRVGTLGYVLCAPAQCEAPASLSWLLYDEAHSGLPQARWMARQGGAISGLKVSDAETLQAAISDGLGKGLLPACVAKRDARIRIIPTEGLPSRDIWLLSHKAQRGLPAVEAAVDWLVSLSWH
ncbi:LysR substrate-binding domain-containing protein [Thalassococcus sp. S3]|uniref:LysR substrate-binding domain-containing protein n=1 Tax=Thalassococcus sp. S3 TaxID=2017482 RepID=UPI0020C1F088|nr:LysR substrate-binding domain-containing protein [Thalassococcus sp. S3]